MPWSLASPCGQHSLGLTSRSFEKPIRSTLEIERRPAETAGRPKITVFYAPNSGSVVRRDCFLAVSSGKRQINLRIYVRVYEFRMAICEQVSDQTT